LKDIQRAVSNNKFPTWEAFITEVEYLWENARTYNKEGSFIHENANTLRVCIAFKLNTFCISLVLQVWFENRLSSIEGDQDIMAPKKLIIKPPKMPLQQPTPRIKFTSSHKDLAQAGIAVDEEARRRQDEHVRAASRGQVVRSTETPVPMTPRRATSRDAPHSGAAPVANIGAGRNQDALIASVTRDVKEDLEGDSSMRDAPADIETRRRSSDNQGSAHRTPSTAPMQPPAVISQLPHSAQGAHAPTARPNYPSSTAFDRVMRDPGKSMQVLAITSGLRELTLSQVLRTPCTHA
jgi:Bromodomain